MTAEISLARCDSAEPFKCLTAKVNGSEVELVEYQGSFSDTFTRPGSHNQTVQAVQRWLAMNPGSETTNHVWRVTRLVQRHQESEGVK